MFLICEYCQRNCYKGIQPGRYQFRAFSHCECKCEKKMPRIHLGDIYRYLNQKELREEASKTIVRKRFMKNMYPNLNIQ